jgi:hypothetical protein
MLPFSVPVRLGILTILTLLFRAPALKPDFDAIISK